MHDKAPSGAISFALALPRQSADTFIFPATRRPDGGIRARAHRVLYQRPTWLNRSCIPTGFATVSALPAWPRPLKFNHRSNATAQRKRSKDE